MKNIFTFGLLLCPTVLLSQAQDSSTYYFQKGMKEKAAKRFLVAATYFDSAIQFNPYHTAAYIENGFVNMEMFRTAASLQNFTKAYELDPGNDVVVKELMELYYRYRQFQNAIDFAQKCKACDGKDRIMALSYFEMEDYGKAEKILSGLVENGMNDAELTYTLARTYLEMGSETNAIPFYEKAIQLDETKSKWIFELGLLYYNNDNYKNAVVYFTKAAELGYIQSNDFYENLGFSYIYSGDFDKGEKLLSDIMARKPGDKEIIRDIAAAFYESKMYDKCLDYCQKLMEMDMKDGKALYQAGLCFQKKGQMAKGQQMCDKAIELDPSLNGLRHKKMMVGL